MVVTSTLSKARRTQMDEAFYSGLNKTKIPGERNYGCINVYQ